ncbi:MAG: glycosyltransferase, partial [Ignavibacteria bacterium]|nr:glycosyltransferase [Ignavibacteria bacterium]
RILSFIPSTLGEKVENYFDPKDSMIVKLLSLLFLGRSPRLTHYWSKSFFYAYRTMLEEFNPDILYVDHLLMMQYPLKYKPDAQIWLYNEESQLYIKKYNLRKNIFDLVKNIGLSGFEKKAISSTYKTFLITNHESEYLKSIGFNSVKTMSYLVDDKFFYNGWKKKQKVFSLLFIGDFSHRPNKEAAKLICNSIYPAIRNLQIKIILVGRNIKKIKKYISSEIEIHENVEDVRSFYWESTLFIAPIFSGAGMRIKILEAASCGLPILMTPLANLGVNLEISKEAFIEDDISGMIEKIKNIYNSDVSNLVNVSISANKKVRSNFGIEKMNKLYDEILSELL